jgi:exosome complex component RRP41
MEMGVFHRAVNGSCRFQIGQTVAIAAVSGPAEAERWGHTRHDRAILNVEFFVSKFSASEHLRSSKGCRDFHFMLKSIHSLAALTSNRLLIGDRKSMIVEATLRQVFEPVLQLHLYPRSEISIMVEVVQNDGGLLPACINAITLALVGAGIPIQDFICASSAGFIDSSPVLGKPAHFTLYLTMPL